MKLKIIRVFPRRTKATPVDDMAFVGPPPFEALLPEADEVHVSCTFTWDKPQAEYLANEWKKYCRNVKIGGPAYDDPGGEFVPGMYLKPGYVITSRGCPNKCTYCYVPGREGGIHELQINDGYDVLDNNFLATNREHQAKVFDMLGYQKKGARFTGGLEACRINDWVVNELSDLHIDILYLAYDQLIEKVDVRLAIQRLRGIGLTQRQVGCYVLVGYQDDTPEKAYERLMWVFETGATPFAMYYRGDNGKLRIPKEWAGLVRIFSRPAGIFSEKARESVKP